MGAGIYIVWPVFYTDVSDSYRLGRWGRVRTDLGGVYFNAVFILAVGALYAATGVELLILGALAVHFQMLQQLLPVLRLDGYLILSDLTGVPDLFTRIGPTLRSLLPGRQPDERVRELKPWARRVVAAWVLVIVPTLLLVAAVVILNLPRIIATAWDSLGMQASRTSDAFGEGDVLAVAVGALRTGLLLAPPIAAAVTAVRLGRRLAGAAMRWSEGSAPRRVGVATAACAAVAVLALTWWPAEQYQPLDESDRLTAAQFRDQLREASRGAGIRQAPLAGREAPAGEPPAEGRGADGSSPDERDGSAPTDDQDGSSESDAPERSTSTTNGRTTTTVGTTTTEASEAGDTS